MDGRSATAGRPQRAAHSGLISASLKKTSFNRSQAGRVRLVYRFSPASKSFTRVLARMENGNWQTVISITRTGTFRGRHKMTIKRLFAGNPVKPGSYRLTLGADRNSVLLGFRIT